MSKKSKLTKQVKKSNLGRKNGSGVEDMINQNLDKNTHNENKEYNCCICGRRFTGLGNNPAPVFNEGRCCDKCNDNVVIPVRLHIDKQVYNARKYPYAERNLNKYQFCYVEIFDDTNTVVREKIVVSRLGFVSGFLEDTYELVPVPMTCRVTGLIISGALNNLRIEKDEVLYQGGLAEWLDLFYEGKQYGVECYDYFESNLVCVECFSNLTNAQTEYDYLVEKGMVVSLSDYDNHICLDSNWEKPSNEN